MRTSLAFAVLCVLLSAPALAEDADADTEGAPLIELFSYRGGDTPRLFGRIPVNAFRAAAAYPTSRLSLWAESDSFAFGVDSPYHAVEGGAALKLLDDWRIMAGYRISGRFSSVGAGGLDLGLSAPFLKLGLDF
jgi:hypothetical protein